MLRSVFGFRGQVTGLQYFMGLLAVVVAAFMGTAAFYDFAEDQNGETSALVASTIGLIAPIVAGLLIWVQLSLTIRRLRDIGLHAYIVTGVWILLTALDCLVALAFPAFAAAPLGFQTPVGELIAMAVTLFLIFWPSRHNERYVAPSGAIYRD